MMQTEYCRAVDMLDFSDDLAARVRAMEEKRPRPRLLPQMVMAAVIACFMITTAFGAISLLQERPAEVEILGTDTEKLTDAAYMSFAVSRTNDGVKKHYMELNAAHQYHFRHGMLWNKKIGYLWVTGDYQLLPEKMNQVKLTFKKNDRSYVLEFDYLETEAGILSNHRSVYHKDENGEILFNATDGNSDQWPVYFAPETGTIRDALPEWSASDFEGRIGGGSPFKGGILLSTIVNDGLPDARNNLYWIAPGAGKAKIIELPGRGNWHAENDTIYYQNDTGQLYCMDENFQFEMICEHKTRDYLQDGLITVSARGKLGILDAYTGELYVFEEIEASVTDTLDYHAIRYGRDGTIALAHTEWKHEPERIVLSSLGVLNRQTAELKLLSIENDYDGYQHGWLDGSRLAVVYQSEDRKFLCIYEFES